VLQGCDKGVTNLFQGAPQLLVAVVLEGVQVTWRCHKGVTRVSQGCYKGVTRVSQGCHKGVTRVLQGCHKGFMLYPVFLQELGVTPCDPSQKTK
jgi:hypothetical protein